MKNSSSKIILNGAIVSLILCLSSCTSTFKQLQGYKRSAKVTISYETKNNCKVATYLSRQTQEKLNGKVKFKYRKRHVIYANFLNGEFHGELRDYKKGILRELAHYDNGIKEGKYISVYKMDLYEERKYWETTISNFKKGIKNGIQEVYRNDKLYSRSFYKNGIKDGVEYFFNEKDDTLYVVNYSYDPDFPMPALEDIEHRGLSTYEYKGKINIMTEHYYQDPLDFYDAVCAGCDCQGYEMYVFETRLHTWLVLFLSVGMGMYYELD